MLIFAQREYKHFFDMALSKTQIIACSQLSGMGRVRVLALADEAEKQQVELKNAAELAEFISHCRETKNVKNLPDYLPTEINSALALAEKIEDDAAKASVSILTCYSPDYPQKLKRLQKNGRDISPLLLFVKGNSELLIQRPSIAIIGTRNPSISGSLYSSMFAEILAKEGLNIVSGLALGCDTAAHKGALKAEGLTTAVLAHGLDSVYPPENKQLATDIVENGGLLVSEYPIGIRAQINYFVERDRIQAGISDATMIIEGDRDSGARHAIHTALNNGRQAYCTTLSASFAESVPGTIPELDDNVAQIISEKDLMDIAKDILRNQGK